MPTLEDPRFLRIMRILGTPMGEDISGSVIVGIDKGREDEAVVLDAARVLRDLARRASDVHDATAIKHQPPLGSAVVRDDLPVNRPRSFRLVLTGQGPGLPAVQHMQIRMNPRTA